MVWINNEWRDKDERQELIDSTSELINKMLEQRDTLMTDELLELDKRIQELKRLERIKRSETDLLYFMMEYFSERYNPGNQGNLDGFDLETADDAPEFHQKICERMDHISEHEDSARDATAAPRGFAKSTYLSRGNPLREIVFRNKKYIISISETPTVAKANLDWIAGQLKTNEKLRKDFGPLLHPKQQMNIMDNDNGFITAELDEEGRPSPSKLLTRLDAASTNQAIRGRNWDGYRPDLIILDDIEDIRSNAATPEQRAKLKDWFTQSVMGLPGPDGKTCFIYMGTIVHQDALLNDIIHKRADFTSRIYKALLEEPERMDLWEKCESIYQDHNLIPEDRKKKALEFYEEHKDEMNKGAKTLWPEMKPVLELMLWKWDNGSKAFNTEMQNNPRDPDSMIFDPEKFDYFKDVDLYDMTGRMLPLDYYGFWDIATGRSRRTDYNAIVTIARNRLTGAMYVVDAWAKKCRIDEAQDMVVEKILQYQHRLFGIETIGIGFDQYNQVRTRLQQERIYHTRLRAISSHGERNKEQRIENLQPLTESGFLRFKESHRLLLQQLEDFPTATHDDLPDALAGAVNLSGGAKRRKRTYYRKPVGV